MSGVGGGGGVALARVAVVVHIAAATHFPIIKFNHIHSWIVNVTRLPII
jgi:hypothetical protein